MSATYTPANVWRIFAKAFVLGCVAAFFGIVIGFVWLRHAYPDSNIAPVLAFAWFGPIAFFVAFAATIIVGMVRKVRWLDDSGNPLTRQLLIGTAPLSVAFLLPLASLICLWIVGAIGTTVVYYAYFPLFRLFIVSIETLLCLAWVFITWRNAQNTSRPVVGKLAQGFSLLWTIWQISGLFIIYLRA